MMIGQYYYENIMIAITQGATGLTPLIYLFSSLIYLIHSALFSADFFAISIF